MIKLALAIGSLFTINHHFGMIDFNTITQLRDYGIAVLVTLLIMPWVARQFDA